MSDYLTRPWLGVPGGRRSGARVLGVLGAKSSGSTGSGYRRSSAIVTDVRHPAAIAGVTSSVKRPAYTGRLCDTEPLRLLTMTDLKDDLAALRIEREPETRSPRRWVDWVVAAGAPGRRRRSAAWTVDDRERPDRGRGRAGHRARRRHAGGGAERVRLRHGPAPGDGLVEDHGQGRRGERRGGHGCPRGPGARAARRRDRPRGAGAGRGAGSKRAKRAVQRERSPARRGQGHARAAARRSSRTASSRRPRSTRRRRTSTRSTRASTSLREQVTVAERQVELAADGPRQHDHPRAVQRRRDLEGRAAGRDGVAGLGRRRLHAHGHLHDRRHAVARDRSGRERELHQPRQARIRTSRRCSTRIRTGRFRRT